MRTGDIIPQVAVDRRAGAGDRGLVYAVWQDDSFDGMRFDQIAFSRASDGGLTWSTPIRINQTPDTLPDGNRQAFTATVRVASDGLGLPVVALTAGTFQSEQETARDAGMDDFIAKPINVATAVEVIMRFTGRGGSAGRPRAFSATQLTASGDSATNASEDFPGLDLTQGLQIWKDPALYARCLRLFEQEYASCVPTLGTAENCAAAALAHKLKGAAATLALNDVAKAAEVVEHDLRKGEPAQQALAHLESALAATLGSIHRYVDRPPNS